MLFFVRTTIYLVALVFIAVWLFTNPSTNSTKEKSKLFIVRLFLKDKSHTGFYVLFVFILQILGSYYLTLPKTFSSIPIVLTGLLITIFGLFVCVWAKFEMRENWGEPATFNSSRQTSLVATGPFAYSRNPIYLGILLMLFGAGIALSTYAVVVVAFLYFHFERVIIVEEYALNKHFKKEFSKYKKSVPRLIGIPKKQKK